MDSIKQPNIYSNELMVSLSLQSYFHLSLLPASHLFPILSWLSP